MNTPITEFQRRVLLALIDAEAAVVLGYSEKTLQKWRNQGTGPRWTSCNGRIWYRRDWIEEGLESIWAKARGNTAG